MKRNMDVVYILKESEKNEELIYSLRSLVNLPHNKIFCVGGCPKEINKNSIIHIKTIQNNNKYQNTLKGLEIVCSDERLSDNFILMNDDFFIISPVLNIEEELNLNWGTIEDSIKRYYTKHKSTNMWMKGLIETKDFLEKMGINNPLNFELHIPFILNKKEFLEMINLPNINFIKALQRRTMIGNLYKKNTIFSHDVKVFQKTNFNPKNFTKFLSCSDKGFQVIKSYLQTKFPIKSNYEI